MSICIDRVLVALIVTAIGGCSAADQAFVSVTVNRDGKSCEVKSHSTTCPTLPKLLTQELGFDKEIQLTVSPEGCGEQARIQASAVADQLKAAGFSHIAVVGSITEPNGKCDG